MKLRKPSSRWALWVFAAALLLKSAMPFLATASAQMQGKALVEVCTVYGVSLVPLGGDGHAPTTDPSLDHSAEQSGAHCALGAFAALATTDAPARMPLRAAWVDTVLPRAHPLPPPADACAAWVARLRHGPPQIA